MFWEGRSIQRPSYQLCSGKDGPHRDRPLSHVLRRTIHTETVLWVMFWEGRSIQRPSYELCSGKDGPHRDHPLSHVSEDGLYVDRPSHNMTQRMVSMWIVLLTTWLRGRSLCGSSFSEHDSEDGLYVDRPSQNMTQRTVSMWIVLLRTWLRGWSLCGSSFSEHDPECGLYVDRPSQHMTQRTVSMWTILPRCQYRFNRVTCIHSHLVLENGWYLNSNPHCSSNG